MDDEAPRPVIVAGLDGSLLSLATLRWAAQQARITGAEVHAVTGWEAPVTIMVTPTHTEADYARDARGPRPGRRRGAGGRAGRRDREAPRPEAARARVGHSIRGSQLLVIGSHGRGELPGMHLGSVASYCVHHAACPVVVVRARDTGR